MKVQKLSGVVAAIAFALLLFSCNEDSGRKLALETAHLANEISANWDTLIQGSELNLSSSEKYTLVDPSQPAREGEFVATTHLILQGDDNQIQEVVLLNTAGYGYRISEKGAAFVKSAESQGLVNEAQVELKIGLRNLD